MKKLLLLISLLACASTYSQVIETSCSGNHDVDNIVCNERNGIAAYLTDSTVWTEYHFVNEENELMVVSKSQKVLLGDTILNDTTYKKVYSILTNYDATNKKVYELSYEEAVRESEGSVYCHSEYFGDLKLYDFTVQAGDTAQVAIWGGDISPVAVLEVDTITLDNGETRKRIFLETGDCWIEGIGSMYGFLYPVTVVPTDLTYCLPPLRCIGAGFTRLVCFKQHDEVLYWDSVYCAGDCRSFKGSSDLASVETDEAISIQLNNQTRELFLTLSDNSEAIRTVSLYDASGQLLLKADPDSHETVTLNLTSAKEGIYIICVASDSRNYAEKIVLQ